MNKKTLKNYKEKIKSIQELAMNIANNKNKEELSMTLHFKTIDWLRYSKTMKDIDSETIQVEDEEDFMPFMARSLGDIMRNQHSKEEALDDSTHNYIEKFDATEALEFLEAYSYVIKRKIERINTQLKEI
tara:strand:+ start:507 stop:896 length:390 start_codon:yes stop_codon:yes gene_type:complete